MKIGVQKPRKVFLSDSELANFPLWITRKYRGFTCIANVQKGVPEFLSGSSAMKFRLPHLEFAKDGIFVGEIYTPDCEDENSLQRALNENSSSIKFAMYDILFIDDKSLMVKPLDVRKDYMSDVLNDSNDSIHIVEEVSARTNEELLTEILSNNWEGVVAADLRGYHNVSSTGKRNRGFSWKLKPAFSIELIVTSVIRSSVSTKILVSNPHTGREYTLGSFVKTLDPGSINKYDIVEVSYRGEDKFGLIHPVCLRVRN